MEPEHVIIAIGRQFGSGGRELGRMLADNLGIAYYDKELLFQAAKSAGMSPELFQQADERFPRFLGGTYSFAMGCHPYSFFSGASSIGDDTINKSISDLIRQLASERSCVIVGRTADYVLRDHPGCVSVFVHAPIEERVRRLMRRGDSLTQQQARSLAERSDKLRASYYNFFTDRTWGAASTYHLSIDSSKMPMSDIVAVVSAYVRTRFPGVLPTVSLP